MAAEGCNRRSGNSAIGGKEAVGLSTNPRVVDEWTQGTLAGCLVPGYLNHTLFRCFVKSKFKCNGISGLRRDGLRYNLSTFTTRNRAFALLPFSAFDQHFKRCDLAGRAVPFRLNRVNLCFCALLIEQIVALGKSVLDKGGFHDV